MAAAEALASLTRGDGGGGEAKAKARKHVEAKRKKTTAGKPSSRRASPRAGEAEDSPTTEKGLGKGETTAPADSSTSDAAAAVVDAGGTEVAVGAEEDEDHEEEEDEGDGDSLSGLSTQSSSSEGPGEPEDTECSIVSVKVAPETRQSVARLAQVQVELEAIEKRATRKYRRMELRFSEMRKPHLDQRGTIIQSIPGFWVTAFLNHPQLSAHIDENDEDALSYMTNLEVDGFKGNKMGYRICFHFSRNPYFQNNIIVKEFHIGMAGSSVSFSNPIFWHRGRNLAAHGKMVKGPGSMRVYQSFFNWFTDHSSPSTDEIAEILKDDLWKNPLRYYLTPVWEPRENGRRADNGNGDECVVISDSEEEGEEEEEEMEEEDDDYDDVGAAGDESREEDLSEEGALELHAD
ncbi:TSYL2 protein, partial [Amia calva]|nr:TSYL2 protein [Amia calva]